MRVLKTRAPGVCSSGRLGRKGCAILKRYFKALKRLGTVEDVAWSVVYLAGPTGDYITGETITVDGGRMGLNYTCAVPEAVPE